MKKLYTILPVIIVLTSAFTFGMSEIDKKLFETVELGDIKGVMKALNAGADPNIQDKYGKTALNRAVWNKHKDIKDIIKILIDAGADLNIQDEDGETALNRAVWSNHKDLKDIIEILIDYGANLNIQNKYGETALNRAVWSDHKDIIEIIEILIDTGADPNIQDEYGETALNIAVWSDHKDIIEIIINSGADPNIADIDGKTALDNTQNADIIIMLEQYMNKINNTIKNINLGTPFWNIDGASSIKLPQWALIKDKIYESGENENTLEFFTKLPIELRELSQVKKITKQDNIPFIDALDLLRLKVYPDFDNQNNDKIMNNIAYTLVKPDTNKKSLFEGIIEQGEGSFIDIEKSLLEKSKKRSYKYWYKLFSDWRINDKTKNYLMEQYLTEFIF